MTCKACNKVTTSQDREDCFEKALDILKQHYIFYKNALEQRDLELQKVNERNEKLNKALQLLQSKEQRQLVPSSKRFKTSQQYSDDSWLDSTSGRITSDNSLTDDEHVGANNLNMALNSEQLFETSALSPDKNDVNIISSSEFVASPRIKESPKRNKQRDDMRLLKDCNNKKIARSKLEWRTKLRNSPSEKSWATKFLKPSQQSDNVNLKKSDKRLCLSLKKSNPSKMKQSLIHFNKAKGDSIHESEAGGDDIIEASPMISTKHGRSWVHRSVQNYDSNNITSNSQVTNLLANMTTTTRDDSKKTLEYIVFDFSPTKKTDVTQKPHLSNTTKSKQIQFDDDISTDCVALPNEQLGITNNKTDSSSVMILTPNTQDIIFVDDSCNEEVHIDTMDLMADILKEGSTDKLENLKKYESKRIQKQQNKDLQTIKQPPKKVETAINIKEEKVTQDLQNQVNDLSKYKPSSSSSNLNNAKKPQNPLLSSEDQNDNEEDEDFMPKPFIIKQEPDGSKIKEKLSIKERFNIECRECEKLISFLEDRLNDEQIKEHLDKCKYHNADIMHQNTPPDFWNPFILSFQVDDPRNEVLIDTRFKEKEN